MVEIGFGAFDIPKWMPGVESNNFLSLMSVLESPKQEPKQITLQC